LFVVNFRASDSGSGDHGASAGRSVAVMIPAKNAQATIGRAVASALAEPEA
jgi:hypothetical protein